LSKFQVKGLFPLSLILITMMRNMLARRMDRCVTD